MFIYTIEYRIPSQYADYCDGKLAVVQTLLGLPECGSRHHQKLRQRKNRVMLAQVIRDDCKF